MSLIKRFLTSFVGEDRGLDEPSGLVEDQSGGVYVIKDDGTRERLGGGGAQPLWAAFDSLVGAEILAGQAGSLGWQTSFIGAGTLTSCTIDPLDNTAILMPDVGCYLVTLNAFAPDFAFGDLSGDVTLTTEIQVFNNETDPWMTLRKRPNGSIGAGVLTAVCNVLASDGPSNRGFGVPVIPEGSTFTPPANFFALKVVQLATT